MKNLSLVVLAAMLSLGGCETVKGVGKINKRLQVAKKIGGSERIVVEPGSYNAEISLGSSSSKLVLKNGNLNYSIPFATPAGLKEGADFQATAAQLGQTFGINGDAKTVVSRSASTSRSESCVLRSYSVPYEYCYPEQRVCRRWERDCRRVDRDRDGHGHQECRDYCAAWSYERSRCETRYRTEYEYGSQTFYGYTETSQAKLQVTLLEGNSVSGQLDFAKNPVSRWVTTSSSGCR